MLDTTDYYAILGVPASAEIDLIKKKYRELARKFHPDVNSSPEASIKIKVINEAYHVLGDADRKSRYDTERALKEQTARSSGFPRTGASKTSGSKPARPSGSSRRVYTPGMEYNGFGRSYGAKSTNHVDSQEEAAPSPMQRATMAAQLLEEARIAYLTRHFQDAEKMCRRAIAFNTSLAEAHEMLGDLLAKRGDKENAAAAYSYAVQYNPGNQSAQIKLERLSARKGGKRRPSVVMNSPQRFSFQEALHGDSRETVLAITAAGALLLLALSFLFLFLAPGSKFLGDFSFNLIFCLIGAGVLSGLLLALRGGLDPLRKELIWRRSRNKSLNLSAPLAVISLIWVGLSFIGFLGVSVIRKRLSRSVMRVYAMSLLLSILFWIIYRPLSGGGSASLTSSMSPLILIFSGNLLLPTMLVGWKIGDQLRLNGSRDGNNSRRNI